MKERSLETEFIRLSNIFGSDVDRREIKNKTTYVSYMNGKQVAYTVVVDKLKHSRHRYVLVELTNGRVAQADTAEQLTTLVMGRDNPFCMQIKN